MTDLSAMAQEQAATWTRPIVYTAGQYNFAGEAVPYFSATLTVNEALRNLELAHQLPVNADDPVRLDELMQRVLDDNRAGEDIVDYLKRPGHIKFFNSLTVVLLPTTAAGRPQDEFGAPLAPPDPTLLNETTYDIRRAGGVLIRQLKGGEVGYLMWQPDRVKAVIIDGQHRFAAIRTLAAKDPHILEADQSRIPILIVAPAAELGFIAPEGAPQSIIATSRAIFTDINKNAKRVSSERQFLLDDVSFSAVAMRRVLTDGIGGPFAAEAHQTPARIPLAAVDWTRADRSRFDDDEWPAISTIRALHQLVVQSMQKQPGEQDWDAWRAWIKWVTDELQPDERWVSQTLIRRLSAAEDREDAFVLTSNEFDAAVEAFPDTRGQIVALPLTRMAPYAKMLAALESSQLLGGKDELWLGQDARGRRAFIARYGDDDLVGRAAGVAQSVKSEHRLAYQVVFQRGFVMAASEVYDARAALAEYWGLEASTGEVVLLHWIGLFNERIAPLLNDPDFWRGTAIAADGSLSYIQVPMRGVAGLVLLLTIYGWEELYGDEQGSKHTDDEAAALDKYLNRKAVTSMLEDEDEDDGSVSDGERDDDEDDLGAALGADRGLRLLDDDPYPSAVDNRATAATAAWIDLLQIRRGPAPGVVPALLRVSARWYRDSLRRYSNTVHQAALGSDPDADTAAEMVVALGSRRLAGATKTIVAGTPKDPRTTNDDLQG
ncbi:DNA sulfur modification protein DndB [Nocardioides sp. C4-1]|uniref:DNA sulfur modification protein DndB n=1 Tax=Nocardioides sp. C4-1 TaxID=3151851 RepID=UPI0032650F2F